MFNVVKEFEFAAAHFLTKYKGKCENPHGHNYKLHVTISSETLNEDDLVIDFGDIKTIVKEHVLSQLDHTDLNQRFENPSCELIAKWIFEQLEPHFAAPTQLTQVQLWETSTSSVIYTK